MTNDLAIRILNGDILGTTEQTHEAVAMAVNALSALSSAQPERLTDDDFETIRIHLNAYKEKLCNQHRWEEAYEYQRIIDRFMSFASAQPDVPDTNVGDMISRQSAIDVLEERLQANGYSNVDLVSELNRSIGYLMRLPSVDAVEVVRCKDCKHRCFDNRFGFMCNRDTCDPYEMGRNAYDDDWFCADGERKDE